MKGHFNLKHDVCTGDVSFCNLDPEHNSLGNLSDLVRFIDDDNNLSTRLIAHDVVEHSLAQRKLTYVTWESEIRAFGAVDFVRGTDFDVWRDLYYLIAEVNRDIKPVPEIVAKGLRDNNWVEVDLMRYLIKEGVSPKNARNAAYHFAWGNKQKSDQFGGNSYYARRVFDFIQGNIGYVIKRISIAESWGASVYFDYDKKIFRHRLIWKT